MDISEIYKPELINKLQEVLKVKCVNGNRITKEQLIKELGFQIPKDSSDKILLQTIVSGVLFLNIIQGYDCLPGPFGGFGVIGISREKPEPDFPDNFINEIHKACEILLKKFPIGVSREQVAREMKIEPNLKNVNLISSAFKLKKIIGFILSRGKGGIRRDVTKTFLNKIELKTGTDN